MMPVSEPDDLLRREVERVTDRLRSWSVERAGRPGVDGLTAADRTHACAQHLADLAADAQGRSRRPVPRLAPHGAADQLAVTANDILDEGDAATIDAARVAVTALRRSL